jgi:molecular chaperone GrpE
MPDKDAQPSNPAADPNSGASPQAGPEPAEADRTTELAAELAATQDRLLRALAEQENMREQARRERDDAVAYAAAGFAADLLSSVDNLERAVESIPEDKRADPVIAGLLAGVEATQRALLDAFAKHGLQRFDPVGDPFDPHRHEATYAIADAHYPPGTVVSVVQPGYMHHDRLLRPALVGVSQAPASPSAEKGDQ